MGNIGEEQPEIEVLPTREPTQPERSPAPQRVPAVPSTPSPSPPPKQPAPA